MHIPATKICNKKKPEPENPNPKHLSENYLHKESPEIPKIIQPMPKTSAHKIVEKTYVKERI